MEIKKILKNFDNLKQFPVTTFFGFFSILIINLPLNKEDILPHLIISLIASGLGYKIFQNQKFFTSKKHLFIQVLSGYVLFFIINGFIINGIDGNILVNNDIMSVKSLKIYFAIIGMISFLYFTKLLEEKYTFKDIFINLIIYLGIGFFTLLLGFFLVTNITILFSISINKNFEIILSVFVGVFTFVFIQYFSDNKKYDSIFMNNIFNTFLVLFTIILYLGLFSDERAILMHLILWLGYLIFALNTLLKRKFISLSIIPLVIYMIYLVIIQIKKYDITENRYFVLTFGILLLIMLVTQSFMQIKTSIYSKIFVFTIFITFFIPKFNAFDLTETRMLKNIENLITKNNLTEKEKKNLRSYISYLDDRGIKTPNYEIKDKILTTNLVTKNAGNKNFEKNIENYKQLIHISKDIYNTDSIILNINDEEIDVLPLLINKKYKSEQFEIIPLYFSLQTREDSHKYSGYIEIIIIIK